MPSPPASLLLVGAGLTSALIATSLASTHPNQHVVILEGSNAPFGEHTWSFHLEDVAAGDLDWLAPLIAHRWPSQGVRFRAYARQLASGYASLTSASVAAHLATLPQVQIRSGTKARTIDSAGATLEDGTRLNAPCVIDTTGFQPNPNMVLGFQKFVGLEIETEAPHGVTEPLIMDASVDQLDGYRFVYLLPFSPTRILVEDTRYADGEALVDAEVAADALHYAKARGWSIRQVVREERGVLPICLAYDAEKFWAVQPGDVPIAGMRAGLFHPTTGYSLPEAVRVANLVADHWPVHSAALSPVIRQHALQRARQQSFYRFLNRMLFRAAEPDKRHLVLQRFYRLPRPLIERFYAGRTTLADIGRILVGKPPVPVHRALTCFSESSLIRMGQNS